MENVSSIKRKLSTETLNELKKTTEFDFYCFKSIKDMKLRSTESGS